MRHAPPHILLLFLLPLAPLAGCAKHVYRPIEDEWAEVIRRQPLSVTVVADSSEAAWKRVSEWFGSQGLEFFQSSDGTMMQTAGHGAIRLMLARQKNADSVTITVQPKPVGNARTDERMERAAHELAYFIATGIDFPEFKRRKEIERGENR
jgi:hypothetical protein